MGKFTDKGNEKKVCDTCGKLHPLWSFSVKRSDGKRKTTCKQCVREQRGLKLTKKKTGRWVDRLIQDLGDSEN